MTSKLHQFFRSSRLDQTARLQLRYNVVLFVTCQIKAWFQLHFHICILLQYSSWNLTHGAISIHIYTFVPYYTSCYTFVLYHFFPFACSSMKYRDGTRESIQIQSSLNLFSFVTCMFLFRSLRRTF